MVPGTHIFFLHPAIKQVPGTTWLPGACTVYGISIHRVTRRIRIRILTTLLLVVHTVVLSESFTKGTMTLSFGGHNLAPK